MTDPIAASDAPSLVSMLAEMRLAAVDYDERSRRGDDPAKAQTMAQADINRTTNAVVDLVRGLRDERDAAVARAETAEAELRHFDAASKALADIDARLAATPPAPPMCTPHEKTEELRLVVGLDEAARRCEREPQNKKFLEALEVQTHALLLRLASGRRTVLALRDQRDEADRLLRVAVTTPQCMECIEERGDARLATYVHEDVSGTHVDVARYYCDECAVRHLDAEEATFADDVRRIAKLTAHEGDAT